MVGTLLKATNSSFQKGMTFCRSIYVKKVMELLAFIFEQPSYTHKKKKRKKRAADQHSCLQQLYMDGPRGGDRGSDPPEKSQKYRVS